MLKLESIKSEKIWGYELWIASTHPNGCQNDFKSAIGNIVNEISEGDLSGLEPPPEMPEETDVKDFSNVQIPSDDELF